MAANSKRVTLLILRPQPAADVSAAQARKMGIESIVMPLFAISPVAWDMPDCADHDALLLTSANAVRAIAEQVSALRALPVHAVGPATAQAAQNAQFDIASIGPSNAERALANAQAAGHHRLLWLTGRDHIELNPPAGSTLDIIPVYQSRPVTPDNAMIDAIQTCQIMALHSPRAARYFAAIVDQAGLDRRTITLATLSPAIAQAAELGWRDILVAQTPDDGALLRLINSYITQE